MAEAKRSEPLVVLSIACCKETNPRTMNISDSVLPPVLLALFSLESISAIAAFFPYTKDMPQRWTDL